MPEVKIAPLKLVGFSIVAEPFLYLWMSSTGHRKGFARLCVNNRPCQFQSLFLCDPKRPVDLYPIFMGNLTQKVLHASAIF